MTSKKPKPSHPLGVKVTKGPPAAVKRITIRPSGTVPKSGGQKPFSKVR
ncbi:MAG: hypothetical protein ACF8R9_13525 [Phycisphaerales bacterium JB054]